MDNNNPKPICPYCGTPMVGEERIERAYWYKCYKCGATTPTEETVQAAYTAAMQRYVEPNRMLTLEEIKELRAVWVEDISRGIAPAIVFPNDTKKYSCVVADYDASDDNVWFDNAEYGKHWRCWLRKPTQKKMEAVPWEKS